MYDPNQDTTIRRQEEFRAQIAARRATLAPALNHTVAHIQSAPLQNEWFADVMMRRRKLAELDACPPFTVQVTEDCEDCGGSGHDHGSLDPNYWEPCPAEGCIDGKVTFTRNYLAEAFRIAAGADGAPVTVEREHLIALTTYARQTVAALMESKEAA